MRKGLVTILLGIAFLSVAVFGYFIMSHGGEHGGCIASDITGDMCPVNFLDLVLHHITALQIFATALTVPFFAGLLASVLLLVFAYILFINEPNFGFGFAVFDERWKNKPLLNFYSTDWLSHLEHSPSQLK